MKRVIIKRVVITEKATRGSGAGKYVFKVAEAASAPEIRKAIKEAYNAEVIKINVLRVKPKQRRLGRSIGVKAGYKKAIVTLKAGQKLDVLPQ